MKGRKKKSKAVRKEELIMYKYFLNLDIPSRRRNQSVPKMRYQSKKMQRFFQTRNLQPYPYPPKCYEAHPFFRTVFDEESAERFWLHVGASFNKVMNAESGKFMASEFNRFDKSYRSPIDNEYYPKVEGFVDKPVKKIRDLEIIANKKFAAYTLQYYGKTGVSSVYFVSQEEGYSACVLINNQPDPKEFPFLKEGVWNSCHFLEIGMSGNKAEIKIQSSIYASLKTSMDFLDFSGYLDAGYGGNDRNMEPFKVVKVFDLDKDKINDSLVVSMGNMVLLMENRLHDDFVDMYLRKTAQIVSQFKMNTSVGPVDKVKKKKYSTAVEKTAEMGKEHKKKYDVK